MIFSDWEPAVNVKMINITSVFVLLSEFVLTGSITSVGEERANLSAVVYL